MSRLHPNPHDRKAKASLSRFVICEKAKTCLLVSGHAGLCVLPAIKEKVDAAVAAPKEG